MDWGICLKDKPKGIRCVAREKIDSFTVEDWKFSKEKYEKMINTVSIREVVFSSATCKDCT